MGLNRAQKNEKMSKIMQESQMWNLLLVTQQNNDEYANITHDEDESSSNNLGCHEAIYKTNLQMHKTRNLFLLRMTSSNYH
jgi:hypothetical protein